MRRLVTGLTRSGPRRRLSRACPPRSHWSLLRCSSSSSSSSASPPLASTRSVTHGHESDWLGGDGALAVQQEGGEAGAFDVEFRGAARKVVLRPAASVLDRLREASDHLLPKDHHTSVTPRYLEYVQWTMAGAVLGTVTGVLSMQSLLMAVGVGAGALPTAAALNWILKDGLGQLGGVLFASVVNQRFDAEPKRWRFKSALILDASVMLDVLTPLFPGYFLPIASASGVLKNIGWLSASATRAGIHRSFMTTENLADITGKAGSQMIASSVVGTGLGIGLSSLIGPSVGGVALAAFVLSLANLGCMHKALATVTIHTLNLQRFWLALRPALQYSVSADGATLEAVHLRPEHILTPDEVAPLETVLHGGNLTVRRHGPSLLEQDPRAPLPARRADRAQARLRVGSPLTEAFPDFADLEAALAKSEALGDAHVVAVTPDDNVVHVLFLETARQEQVLGGMLHAAMLHQTMLCATPLASDPADLARHCMGKDGPKLVEALAEKGWDTGNSYFEPFRARIRLPRTHI